MKWISFLWVLLFSLQLTTTGFADQSDEALQAYNSGEYQKAFAIWKPLAEGGDSYAQAFLGYMHERGEGTSRDDAEAARWYGKAAEQGHAVAQYNLGSMYANGRGVSRDDTEAIAWFRKSADQGYPAAQSSLAMMYEYGQGVEKDPAEAIRWYRKAADQGDATAQNNLGAMYHNGRGVSRDYPKAIAWYRKAAEQEAATAQCNLGVMYEFGQGVAQDHAKATEWYKKAADQGYPRAQEKLKQLTEYAACMKTATTELFGEKLSCAHRNTLRTAVKSAGARVKIEEDNKWGDTYYTDSVLKNSSELYIGYDWDNRFAVAQYTFPSSMDAQQVTRIKEMVQSKYGPPDQSSGSAGLGDVTYTWTLEDGIELKVHRGWPNTTTFLTYTHPQNYQAMKRKQEELARQKEKEQFEAQSNAF